MVRVSNVGKLVGFALIAFLVIFFVVIAPSGAPVASQPAVTAMPSADAAAKKLIAEFFEGAEAKVQCPSARHWAPEELAMHASQRDALVVIHGFVLNVTEFLSHHPGGVGALMRGVGGVDAAELFTQFHQPNTVTMFKNFCVGRSEGLTPAH
jgi:hypothetical protein